MKTEENKYRGKQAPIKDRTLWDRNGNYCRISMFQIGDGIFELWLHRFNDAVPTRIVGSLGDCLNIGDVWLSQRKEDGFEEQLPGYTPSPIN